jgi:2-polyprenyl-3-methyl-5-hydroxy-6-metoxy-1,4-benzoquinol methylase
MSQANINASFAPACPVCATPCTGAPRHRFRVEQAAAHFCPPTRSFERYQRLVACIRRLWDGDTAEVYICPSCGFGFGHPYKGGDEEFYSVMADETRYPRWKWDYQIAFDHVIVPQKMGRILDIGAGVGYFLQRLPESWEKFATEASPFTREELAKRGVNCYTDTHEAMQKAASTFDVVTLFQVLEHLDCFRQVIQDTATLLKPGGKTIIVVPNAEKVWQIEKYTGCLDMIPNHINKWTPQSLTKVLAEFNLSVCTTARQPPSLGQFLYCCALAVTARGSYQPRSIAARAYRIKSRRWRVPLFAALAVGQFVKLLPHARLLSNTGSLAVIAVKS